MKKLLALLLAVMMILALTACGRSRTEESAAPAVAEAAPAEAADPVAPAAEAPDGVTWADYQAYLIEKASANSPDLEEFKTQVYSFNSWEEIDQTTAPWDQLFATVGLSTWEEFQAGIIKEPAVMGTAADDGTAYNEASDASGEPSGKGSGEPRAAAEVPEGVETKEIEIPFDHPIAGQIALIVIYYGDAASGITLVSVVDPELGEDILPVQSAELVESITTAVIQAIG